MPVDVSALMGECHRCGEVRELGAFMGRDLCDPCWQTWAALLERYGRAFEALTMWVMVLSSRPAPMPIPGDGEGGGR